MNKEQLPQQPEKSSELQGPRPAMNFCHAPSDTYLEELDDWGGDPRSVAGAHAIRLAMSNGGGWVPDWDGRAPDLPPSGKK